MPQISTVGWLLKKARAPKRSLTIRRAMDRRELVSPLPPLKPRLGAAPPRLWDPNFPRAKLGQEKQEPARTNVTRGTC